MLTLPVNAITALRWEIPIVMGGFTQQIDDGKIEPKAIFPEVTQRRGLLDKADALLKEDS